MPREVAIKHLSLALPKGGQGSTFYFHRAARMIIRFVVAAAASRSLKIILWLLTTQENFMIILF